MKNVVHRDLKLDNILLHFPGQDPGKLVSNEFLTRWNPDIDEVEVIIGDLGFAKKMEDDQMTVSYCGTPLNMAPQVLYGQSYDNAADIWSLGTMVYEMLVGFAPFTGYDTRSLAQNL